MHGLSVHVPADVYIVTYVPCRPDIVQLTLDFSDFSK